MQTSNGWILLDGAKVYDARQRLRLRQADVTERLAGLGVTAGFSQSRISHIETGNDFSARWATPWEVTCLAAVLGQAVWAILARDPDEDPRIAEARDLTAKLAQVLAPRTAGQLTEARQEPEAAPMRLLMAEDG
jgi:hypothetical protein